MRCLERVKIPFLFYFLCLYRIFGICLLHGSIDKGIGIQKKN